MRTRRQPAAPELRATRWTNANNLRWSQEFATNCSGTAQQSAVVRLGRSRGLNIRSYTPPAITIWDDDHPGTNWSKARAWSARGTTSSKFTSTPTAPTGSDQASFRRSTVRSTKSTKAWPKHSVDSRETSGGVGRPGAASASLKSRCLSRRWKTSCVTRQPDRRQCIASRCGLWMLS